MVRVLTIAGSDSSGGAGIQADLKTFCAFGVYGASVITSLTAQNTVGVQGIMEIPPEFAGEQLESVLSDMDISAVKIGMLYTKETIEIVAEKLGSYGIKNIVLDPVMFAKSGDALLKEDARKVMSEKLIPLCRVVTPNIPEAELLAGCSVTKVDDMKTAAEKIYALGCESVIVKGGHLKKNAVDLLYDGSEFLQLGKKRILGKNPHGTGCTFSSALTAGLAKGLTLREAFKNTKDYMENVIKRSLAVGKGFDVLDHNYKRQIFKIKK